MMEATRVASPTYSSRSLAGSKEGNQQTTSPWNPVRLTGTTDQPSRRDHRPVLDDPDKPGRPRSQPPPQPPHHTAEH